VHKIRSFYPAPNAAFLFYVVFTLGCGMDATIRGGKTEKFKADEGERLKRIRF
jgi:hypothetical protein